VCNSDSERRVAKLKFWLPPSALKRAATAMASIRVDLPLPFSPTKKLLLDADRASRAREWPDGEWIPLEALHLFPDQGDGPDEGVEPSLPGVGQAARSVDFAPSRLLVRAPPSISSSWRASSRCRSSTTNSSRSSAAASAALRSISR